MAAACRRSNGDAGSCSSGPERETHPMSMVSPAIQNLTRRLIAIEATRADPSGAHAVGSVRVLEKLRAPLSKLAGGAGFRSLLSRALTLAKAEDASLNAVQVRADGSLEESAGDWHGPEAGAGEA